MLKLIDGRLDEGLTASEDVFLQRARIEFFEFRFQLLRRNLFVRFGQAFEEVGPYFVRRFAYAFNSLGVLAAGIL